MRYVVLYSVVALVISLTAGMSTGVEAPSVTVRVEHYDIRGTTASELRHQLDEKGIEWTDGNTYDAYTRWYVRWRFNYIATPSGCAITSVRTSVEIVHTMPRWKDRGTR